MTTTSSRASAMADLASSVGAAQKRLRRLAARHAAGEIDAAQLAAERMRIEQEVGRSLLAAGAQAAPAAPPEAVPARPSRRLVGALAVAVLAVACAGYAWKGSPFPRRGAAGPEAAAGGGADATSLPQIAEMVDKLAARMKERPDDAEGWIMLGRSYAVLGRFGEALPAYRRALELQPGNAGLHADLADVLIASQGGRESAESDALIARALALDANHPKALALAGTAAYDRGDYAGAVSNWQKLADTLPPQSEFARQVQASIAEAQAKSGTATAPARAPVPTAAAASSVSGTVTLAPDLARQAAPGDTVFVFARAAGGGRMPLAVQRATVADLPLHFTLDDSMAMAPTQRLSGAARVIVGARISKSGQAIPQPGDLSGEAAPVAPGASGIAIRIDSVVGAR